MARCAKGATVEYKKLTTGQAIRFEWVDSAADSGWYKGEMSLAGGIVTVQSAGWVVNCTRDYVTVTSSAIPSEEDLEAILNVTSVPWAAILRMTELTELDIGPAAELRELVEN